MLFFASHAQQNETAAEVDVHSLSLYNAAQWEILLIYGKGKLASGIDFPLLRMRTGYAAFMMGNYSQSLVQYKKVYDDDGANTAALYYVYLNNLYLNNPIAARYYAAKLPAETQVSEKIVKTKISSLQTEYSYKIPDDTARRAAQYARVGFNLDLGRRLQLQQSVAYYTLLVNTTLATNIVTYQKLQQTEYYAKFVFAVTGQVSLIGAYHYISDQFPNTTFNSNIYFAGIKYSTPYFSVQADAGSGNFATDYVQYDGIFTIYPLGNLNLYSISKYSSGTQSNFSQVLGAKLSKALWIEGNTTLGKADYLFDNDALYVKNDPDVNQFRCGASVYALLSKKLLLTLNYTFEQRQKQLSLVNNYFYQHSINGGLTWKF